MTTTPNEKKRLGVGGNLKNIMHVPVHGSAQSSREKRSQIVNSAEKKQSQIDSAKSKLEAVLTVVACLHNCLARSSLAFNSTATDYTKTGNISWK